MRWDVVGFVLGWTIRIVALPLVIVAAYSCYLAESEGYEFAARTYLLPLLIAAVVGQGLVSLPKEQTPPQDYETGRHSRLSPWVGYPWFL